MLGAIKGKLQSVQNDISEGFRQLRKKRPLSQRGLPSNVSFHLEFVNADAGAEVLHNYTESWHRIHNATSENAEKARAIDTDLHSLTSVVERKSTDLMQLQKELRRLSVVSDELSNLITETAKLEGLCEEVESALAYLDVLCHTEDAQNIKLEQRFQLALYRERKVAELNESKTQMALDFMQETDRLDKRRQQQQTEKLKVLQQAAEKDIKTFKTSGIITNSLLAITDDELETKRRSTRTSQSLDGDDGSALAGDECSPDFGFEERHALEEFLADVRLDDSGFAGDTGVAAETEVIVEQDPNGNSKI